MIRDFDISLPPLFSALRHYEAHSCWAFSGILRRIRRYYRRWRWCDSMNAACYFDSISFSKLRQAAPLRRSANASAAFVRSRAFFQITLPPLQHPSQLAYFRAKFSSPLRRFSAYVPPFISFCCRFIYDFVTPDDSVGYHFATRRLLDIPPRILISRPICLLSAPYALIDFTASSKVVYRRDGLLRLDFEAIEENAGHAWAATARGL